MRQLSIALATLSATFLTTIAALLYFNHTATLIRRKTLSRNRSPNLFNFRSHRAAIRAILKRTTGTLTEFHIHECLTTLDALQGLSVENRELRLKVVNILNDM